MRLDLKGIHTVTTPKGKVYRYAWRGGPRLLASPGTDAFIVEVAEARASRVTGDRSRVSGLCALYRASDAWTADIGDATRASWSPWLDRIQKHFGEPPIRLFDDPKAVVAIISWRDKYKEHRRSADVALEALSRLLSFGRSRGLLVGDPCKDVGRLYEANRAAIIWTEADLATLAASANPAVVRAATLAGLTGLRKSDLLSLTWGHVKANCIDMPASKSQKRGVAMRSAVVPLYADLRDFLAGLRGLLAEPPKPTDTVLLNSDGEPWAGGFGSSFGKAKARAGLEHLHLHDLRGTAATRFYIALRRGDVSDREMKREIADMMAWSETAVGAIIDRYVSRDTAMQALIKRLDANAA